MTVTQAPDGPAEDNSRLRAGAAPVRLTADRRGASACLSLPQQSGGGRIRQQAELVAGAAKRRGPATTGRRSRP